MNEPNPIYNKKKNLFKVTEIKIRGGRGRREVLETSNFEQP